MDSYDRVVRALREMAKNVDGRYVIEKAPSRQEIASMIGTTREMVSRVMRERKAAGRVQEEKHRIILLDKPRARRARKVTRSV